MNFGAGEGDRGSRRFGIGLSYVAFGLYLAAALLLMKLVVSFQWLSILMNRIVIVLD